MEEDLLDIVSDFLTGKEKNEVGGGKEQDSSK